MLKRRMQPHARRWSILLLVMTGVFLSTMDSGMVNVALPTIMRSLGLNLERAEFVVTCYLVTIVVSLVFWGRLSDRFGRGNIYLAGMVVFASGALACYLSTNYERLLVSRFIQALGASMMMASGPAIIKTVFPTDYLGLSLGLIGIATACGLLVGPFIAGLLLSIYPWQTIFLVGLPISVIAFFFGKIFLIRHLSQERVDTRGKFDWRGSCCWVILIVLYLTILQRFNRLLTPPSLLLFFAFIIFLYIFLRIEKVAGNPILPVTLFRQRYYWIGVLTATISFAVLFIVLVLVPFYLEYILLFSSGRVGQIMMAMPASLIILSPCSGWLYDRIGARYLTTVGLSISSVALLGLAWLSPESSGVEVGVKLAILGAGQSIFLSPNSASILAQVSKAYIGITSGILATARNLGMVTGATLAAALFSWCFGYFSDGGRLIEYTAADSGNFILALRLTFILTAVMAIIGTLLSAQRR